MAYDHVKSRSFENYNKWTRVITFKKGKRPTEIFASFHATIKICDIIVINNTYIII